MLKVLRIKNFALIDELELEFGGGFNVFTGETGAGKSIIVEALGFVLGEKMGTDIIAEGKNFAEVCGVFLAPFSERQRLEMRRMIFKNGKGKFYLNSKPVALSTLRQTGDALVDFHGQNEHQSLLCPQIPRKLLDSYAGIENAVKNFAVLFERRRQMASRLDFLKHSSSEKERQLDFYRFQLKELEESSLREGEEEELEEMFPKLKNADKIISNGSEIYKTLYSADFSALNTLAEAAKKLSFLSEIDAFFVPLSEDLKQAKLLAEEVAFGVRDYIDKMDVDPARIESCTGRLNAIRMLKKKYGKNVKELLEFIPQLKEKINDLQNMESNIEDVEKDIKRLGSLMWEQGQELHLRRKKAAEKLSSEICAEAKKLGFKKLAFEVKVEFNEDILNSWGMDEVDFMFSANPDRRMRPLKTVASGGEMSRIMLAIKTVFARADRVPVLVFDEVDTGVTSAVGRLIGEKFLFLSNRKQILCITHLPQLASFARTHFHVEKSVLKGKTRVSVKKLDNGERKREIATMLGGKDKSSRLALKHAEEMILEAARNPGGAR